MTPLSGISYDILLPFILSSRIHIQYIWRECSEWKAENCFSHSANNLLLLLLFVCQQNATIAKLAKLVTV